MDQVISNQTIWEAIQQVKNDMLSHLDSKMDILQTSLNTIQSCIQTIAEQVTELEHRVSASKDNFSELGKCVSTLEKENSYL